MTLPKDWRDLMIHWARTHIGCDVCGNVHLGPIVKDRVWEKIEKNCEGNTLLCYDHMIIYLGRPILWEDLAEFPWNSYWVNYWGIYLSEPLPCILT